MPILRFLSGSMASVMEKTSGKLRAELGWGKDLKQFRGDSVITFQLNAIFSLFRAEREGINKTGSAITTSNKEYLDHSQEVKDAISDLPNLEQDSVGKRLR